MWRRIVVPRAGHGATGEEEEKGSPTMGKKRRWARMSSASIVRWAEFHHRRRLSRSLRGGGQDSPAARVVGVFPSCFSILSNTEGSALVLKGTILVAVECRGIALQ